MNDTHPSSAEIDGFRAAVESLKLYRRADLNDPEHGTSLIEELYVDPLPQDDVLKTVLRPHTTFVIGRKGTGKSTVFQRLQHELRKTSAHTSAYLDIKTLFESAQPDPGLVERLESRPDAMPRESIERLTLYREFLKATIQQIREELKKRIDASIWERVKERFTGTYADLFEDFDALLEEASEDKFLSVLGVADKLTHESLSKGTSSEQGVSVGAVVASQPSLKAEAADRSTAQQETSSHTAFSDILIRAFNIKELLDRLKKLLMKIEIRHLYVLIDDFSELPEEAMRIVVDALLAPLNNWSDEFIKFKVAAYPGRIYYGDIDRTKIDEVYLDLFSLFGTSDVTSMEETSNVLHQASPRREIEAFCEGRSGDFL